jgi:dipeptidase E
MTRQIVALGGGGFMMEPDNPRLDDYILGLARGRESRVCFVPTATGDSDRQISAFFRLLGSRCRGSYLPLFQPDVVPAAERLDVDIIYVSGGNTANMLALWRVHGIDRLMREAYERGVILCGLSAGAVCWFEEALTDSFGLPARPMDCLGFLPGSFCPHYDGEPHRAPVYRGLVASGGIRPGWAVGDGAALHFVDGALVKGVASRPGARAHRVEVVNGVVEESPIALQNL